MSSWINLCEIKYSDHLFTIDKPYAKQLANKVDVFERHCPTKKQIFLTLITTEGLKPSIWSDELIAQVVELKKLL